MPASNSYQPINEGDYTYVYNQSVSETLLFKDSGDFETFQEFLRQYLSPADPTSSKKNFFIRGQPFTGSPHQPKNYFKQVELVAYALTPDHFHLLIHHKDPKLVQSFMKSLCTRYSIYFNAKYERQGPLFGSPYKSRGIQDGNQLLEITRYIHNCAKEQVSGREGTYSSNKAYLDSGSTPWVNIKHVIEVLQNSGKNSIQDLKDFLELERNYEPAKQSKSKETVASKQETKKEDLEYEAVSPKKSPITLESKSYLGVLSRTPELVMLSLFFVLLLTQGLQSVSEARSHKNFSSPVIFSNVMPKPIPTPQASSSNQQSEVAGANDSAAASSMKVFISDSYDSVYIYKEATTSSLRVGEAKAGDMFELIGLYLGWNKVKRVDGQEGYILSTYLRTMEGEIKQ